MFTYIEIKNFRLIMVYYRKVIPLLLRSVDRLVQIRFSAINNVISGFGLLFSKPMFSLFLQLSERKVLDPNGKFDNKKCVSVGNFGIMSVLWSVAHPQSTPPHVETGIYTKNAMFYSKSSQRGPIFFIFETVFRLTLENTAQCLKKISQKWRAFLFGST